MSGSGLVSILAFQFRLFLLLLAQHIPRIRKDIGDCLPVDLTGSHEQGGDDNFCNNYLKAFHSGVFE